MEASGTSGMKAAHNGIPSLSVLDGWWMEGHIEGVTGWSIGSKSPEQADDHRDALEIYDKLEDIILPMYYKERERWSDVMRHSIALNGSFFQHSEDGAAVCFKCLSALTNTTYASSAARGVAGGGK